MGGQIVIRKALASDAQAVWEVRNASIRSECRGHYGIEALEIWTAGELTKQFVEAVAGGFYVAVADGLVVGAGMIDLGGGKVDAVFVHPGYLRRGIGRQLLAHLEGLAIDAGISELHLDSTLNAAVFYRACGYVGDTIAKYESPRGISLDCVPMVKQLAGVSC